RICGEPDRPPVHMGFPVADAVTGLFGAVGILAALYRRAQKPDEPGQEIDLSLVESTFRMLDFLPIEYDQLGIVRERAGNLSEYSAPSNVYRSKDGIWVTIPASSQNIFVRLCRALSRDDVAKDARFMTNADRVRNRSVLDQIVADEIARRTLSELGALFDRHEVGWSPIQSIADVFADPHFQARESIISVEDTELGPIKMQNVVPRFSNVSGRVASAGPALGQHNDEIYRDLLGLSDDELQGLKAAEVI